MEALLAIIVFVISYIFLLQDKLNRALVALSGAALLVLFGLFELEEALTTYVDWGTIILLFSMMVIITITQRTGLFEYIALMLMKRVNGKPIPLFIWAGILTAVGSAFLDNVTTVLLFVPILLHMIKRLNLPAFPFLVMVIITSNVGGTATMIGDPPNIMIGQAVEHLTFTSFIINLGPIVLIIFALTMLFLLLIFYKPLQLAGMEDQREILLHINPNEVLKKTPLFYQSITVLVATIIGFTLHGFLHIELTMVATVAALVLLLLSEKEVDCDQIFSKIEWTTLFFFVGLFVLVGGLEQVGIIDWIAVQFIELTEGNVMTSSFVILWSAGLLSGFVDNIPYVASMIPVLFELEEYGMVTTDSMWWALALGACLGGNGSLLGASANVVVAGIASTQGVKINFVKFMGIGLLVVVGSLILATIYLQLRYF